MKRILLAILAVFLVSGVHEAAAQGFRPNRWEFRAGYGYQYTNASRPNDFHLLSVMPSADFQLTAPAGPAWFRGTFHWNPELDFALFTRPYDRPKIGVTPLQFRWQWETGWFLRPYVSTGAGILYANVNRRETRHDLNFNLQLGLGLLWDLSDRISLVTEYRHVHISNAGLHEDNAGINNHNFLIGVSIRN